MWRVKFSFVLLQNIINLFVIYPEGGKESGQNELISQNVFTVKA